MGQPVEGAQKPKFCFGDVSEMVIFPYVCLCVCCACVHMQGRETFSYSIIYLY